MLGTVGFGVGAPMESGFLLEGLAVEPGESSPVLGPRIDTESTLVRSLRNTSALRACNVSAMRTMRRLAALLMVTLVTALALFVTLSSLGQPAPMTPQSSASASASAPPAPSISASAAPSATPLASSSAAAASSSAVEWTPPPPFDPPFKPNPPPEPVDTAPPVATTTAPPPQVPPPAAVEERGCCRAAVRFDPFDILQRKLSFQAELAIWGPFAIEVEPSWIFSSPSENVSADGFSFLGSVGFYLTSKAPLGFFIKAVVGYETFTATVTNPDAPSLSTSADVDSPILGAVLGSSTVFGRKWGFNISGSIGIGVSTASEVDIVAPGKGSIPPYKYSYYDSAVQLLGSLAAGIGF
jgi:hypothetical protein